MKKHLKSKKYNLFFVSGFILFIAVSVLSVLLNNHANKLKEIEETYEKGEVDKAEDLLLDYLFEEKKESALAWTIYGEIALDRGDVEDAEGYFLEAIRLDEEFYKAISGLGVVERLYENLDASEDYYNQALEIKKDYAPAITGLAAVQVDRKNYSNALELAQKAYSIDKNDSVIVANLAIIYNLNNMKEKANLMLKRAEELDYENIKDLEMQISSSGVSSEQAVGREDDNNTNKIIEENVDEGEIRTDVILENGGVEAVKE
jgi:tetratricopeptide (TPR) repeat protein